MDTKTLRQKILDLAIRGKLVPQDPNDEPASVLLERIKAEKERLIKEGKIKRSKKSAKTSDTPHYENVPFEVPEGWESVPVSDLFLLNPKSEIDDTTHCGFIPMSLVEDGFSGNHLYEERIWKDIKKGYCHFQNGDIGIAKISPCFENRKSTIFENLPNGYGAGTTELVILRPIILYTKFYLYVFKSDWYVQEGTKYFKGVVGQQRVHKEIFTDLQIPLPPFAEQQRIVAEIERWFSLIDIIENEKDDLQTTIKQTKSKILDLAIHGKLVPQDPNDEPAIKLLKRINPDFVPCDNGHSEKLPSGWCIANLGMIGVWQSGGTPSRSNKSYYEGSIPWLKTGDLNDGLIMDVPERITEEAVANSSAKINPTGSVLIAMYGATIGKLGILAFPATTNQACCACIEFRGITQLFLFYFLLSQRKTFVSKGGGGAQPNISKEIIVNHDIHLPPLAEQQRIVQKIEELFSVLDNIQNALEV
ncbi:restriction endonuclease subunit S [Alistipes onderdonkii]|nr:restriction endonuclease subunit S [Bacteroides faecis]KAA2426700.1 restriction endonuclease subunit S [Alistipes onderdonkii]MTT06897.1 restriction endonuclease subunit S [Proteus mirabilis]KAA2481409.1 restriction endonuclease subunit S [Alistipes onderdonkii]KAA2509502.1 restriction endonuclease subunit S [Alistipes onderdonkii]KAA2572115.1 restriction endonuclease subunit S [Alistipes onderdonkii]